MWAPLSLALASLAIGSPLAVPFVPQHKDTCGAAALAMVAAYWGQDLPQDETTRALLQPELHGIAGSRLADLARQRGLEAWAYEGDLAHLREFVGKGRPLIVAWSIGRGRYHDVVVIGFDEARGEVIVNDPARGPGRRVAAGSFEKRWAGAGHWTLLILPRAVER
jgi:ABC-type bacteriocin/lantibiotic exporter with double-glycine peptidase domain